MKNMHRLLDEAEQKWRDEVRENFPLRGNTRVVRDTKQNGRDWTFSTDLTTIFANIAGDENLQKKFKDVIAKYWTGEPEELARETLHYLLYHELYHPLEAPFSVEGPKNDSEQIHQAMRRGLLKAEPTLTPLEQLVKVSASQNGVKDFILDNRFYLDNKERKHVRDDIVPTWDVLELQDAPTDTNFYTVTRLLYGLLYAPETTHEFFNEKAGKDGVNVAEKALSALLEKPVKLPRTKGLLTRAKEAVLGTEELPALNEYIPAIRAIFAGDDRYNGIERFMSVLGPYIKAEMPQGRSDMQGEGSGASPQNLLQDLLNGMTPEEQQQFLEGLHDHNGEESPKPRSRSKPKDGTSAGPKGNAGMPDIDLYASHEFYKRNHPDVTIISNRKVGELIVVGKQEYWTLKSSTILTESNLGRLNLNQIDLLHRRTRLPWLMNIGGGLYRFNDYELRERDVKDTQYVDAKLDVPDAVEFYLDSSGSMGTQNFKPNDESGWDMLSNVVYGFIDALRQGGQQIGKSSKVRFHNFANKQVTSDLIPVDQFWNGDGEALRVLFKPNNGYNVEDLNIERFNDGQRRAYVVATDGALVIQGRTEREAPKMKELAKTNQMLLFEIGGTYSLGEAVKSDPNIVYHPVHNKAAMLQAGIEVLLSK